MNGRDPISLQSPLCLTALPALADDKEFRVAFRSPSARRKQNLPHWPKTTSGLMVDPDAIFG
jgi:hypothetical protein